MSDSLLCQRSSGILLHISSLPGPHFVGDLGAGAFSFVDALAVAKQRWWQVLPLNPVGAGNSPYSTVCSFAGEPLFISLEKLVDRGLLEKKDLKSSVKKNKAKKCQYDKARKVRLPLLRKAAKKFDYTEKGYLTFCKAERHWLDDYAHFIALADQYKTCLWSKWPKDVRTREKRALEKSRTGLAEEINFYKFCQYMFHTQWQELKIYAAQKNVGLIGDIPIFVSFESSDVWANQIFFEIDKDGKQQYVAGVPPDYFNADGQRWGNALYRWEALKKDGFKWWLQRFSRLADMFDITRIDHFIGFYRYWEIPASAKTAKTGKWKLALGDELFAAALKEFGSLPFIAEDLGLLTPEVTALREKYELPSMKVLHFAFANDGGKSSHLPFAYERNTVVYTGTHDNDTTVGWYNYAVKHAKKKNSSFDLATIKSYFGGVVEEIHWQMVSEAYRSVANLAIVPLQDILGLDQRSRMNIPGTPEGNWEWRFDSKDLKASVLARLAGITSATGRVCAKSKRV